MRRIVIGLILFLVIIMGAAYIFVPENLKVSQITLINSTEKGSYRSLADLHNWHKWWPQNNEALARDMDSNLFSFNNTTFVINGQRTNGVEVQIQMSGISRTGNLFILPLSGDTIAIQWQTSIPSGHDPFTRLKRYLQATQLKKTFSIISGRIKQFLEKKENIYNFSIQNTSTQDTILIATKSISRSTPGINEMYKLVYELRKYVLENGAKESGFPMTNITQLPDSTFQIMVAIPTNKELPETKNVFPRKMIKGNFLITEVTGGPFTVHEALKQLQYYAEDYRRVPMAIPFESLITDRLKVTDTSKWRTKVYLPIM